MTFKPLTHSLSGDDLDLILHATTDEELAIMKALVEKAKNKGADIYNLKLGKFPMVMHLIQQDRLKSIKILMELGLNMHATCPRNNNALHFSAQKNNKYISFFIKQGVNVHHRNDIGFQPLALACNNLSIVNTSSDANTRISNLKSLIDAGANINDINPVKWYPKGRTALEWAITPQSDTLLLLDFLMQQPELEIRNVNGRNDSALHIGAAQQNLEMIQYLIKTGRFDLDQVNDQGLTALDVARRNGANRGAGAVVKYLNSIYAAWAEKKELDAITSLPAKSMANAKGMESGMSRETEGAKGSISGGPSDPNLSRADGEAGAQASLPSSKPRSL